eukprot:281505-Lingulodinium_polyedra.AAC.1
MGVTRRARGARCQTLGIPCRMLGVGRRALRIGCRALGDGRQTSRTSGVGRRISNLWGRTL